MINPRSLYRQLSAIRELIDCQLEELAPLVMEEPTERQSGCAHPENERLDITVFGSGERWICKTCGFEFAEQQEDKG